MVTIIITYIDELSFLKEAIRSALEQQDIEKEIIIVCNAPSLPDTYPSPQENIKFIHEPKTGSAYARNAGLHAATGDWIQFLDVDDLLLPEKIKHQIAHSEADAVVSPHLYKFTNGKTQPSNWSPHDLWTGILSSSLGSTSSMLWKRKALEAIGGWNTAYQSHQEYELLFRLLSSGCIIVPENRQETIVRERQSGSITQRTKTFRAEQGIQLREEIWSYFHQHGLTNPLRYDAFRQYIFRQLRATYRRNPHQTDVIFKKYLQANGFTPKNLGIPLYNLIYGILGFTKTEDLFHFYSRMRDKYFPFLPVNK